MKKLVTSFKFIAVLSVLTFSSCSDDNNEITKQETVQAKITTADLKKETTPTSQAAPDVVQIQLSESQKNLEKYLNNDLQIAGVNVIGKISTQKGIELSQHLISNKDQFIAVGNLMDLSTVKLGRIGDLYTGDDLSTAQTGLKEMVTEEIKTGTNVMEVIWSNKNGKFTTLCFYNESGIIWDNVLGSLTIMDTRGTAEDSNAGATAKVASKWYKEWWTAKWLWGSKRGEAGYQITIYYTGSSVSNADVNDWSNISLGKAKSESKITKRTGAYGQCQYALGLCTPTGSLSFNASKFSVSFSGLGSNIVANGTKSLYP
ncbi:hypothetical protein [Chryseobacterium sp. BIGb0232]|uniref:hypothetical protein n=1 Tax=Chryseobacterium sp. BIGb0232 TaxID=2940598 RepID=UPI000F477804|nr:hypothetical protein [Chryseobacterium sp. BIGb0232]MCS4301963.1 hypothetical protein [Chryseobacterium sp. BIGb0232]ROS17910.1 hypothetical protein EDF65_2297 [Chryseobacterium nakagawai]